MANIALGGLQIDRQRQLCLPHNRQIRRPFPFQNAINV